jgi:uncharacterized protein (TIGR03067 family)
MYRRPTAAVALLVVSLAFAPAPVYRERPDPKGVLKQLQGTWELKTPPGRVSTLARIKGDTWNYVFVTNGVESEGSPSRIILSLERGLTTLDLELQHPVPGVSPLVLRALVEIEGDRLSVCYSPATNPKRPRTFAGARPWLGVVDDKDISPCTMTFRKLK